MQTSEDTHTKGGTTTYLQECLRNKKFFTVFSEEVKDGTEVCPFLNSACELNERQDEIEVPIALGR